jgi:hypothetical protein
MTRLSVLVAGLSPRRLGFDPGPFRVRFVVDEVAIGQGFLRVLRFSLVNIIPPILHTHSFIYYRHYINLAIENVVEKYYNPDLI